MKHLITYAHPNQESLNGQFKQAIEKILEQQKQDVIVRDLYTLGFDPVLSLEDMTGQRKGIVNELIKKEQEYISWADILTFIYPIWWTGMPAIMKGYIDRVFSYGFAYRYDQGIQKGLLTGKQAIILNTHGKSNEEYSTIGMDKALLLTSDKGIYTYCGFQVKEHFFFDKADRATPEIVEIWLSKIRDVYTKIGSQLSNC
ncbi:NAD(P)H-dependent oxidoreductase [Sphingobacterium sp. ML3W]|uniref:NAD(P)H-dependent oxidoreductase n=1 Tax=Sphingobacterium sp. ML3W TaxID=1538644 RepID=UPI00249C06AA|nr:NAD(P)H-dependent oxidoreductase [Sphingobacterium sp. ML3W]WFA81088.1 NAD(P)H-dependent oxidoreductase [Sphingobacterium sp. ML3W]